MEIETIKGKNTNDFDTVKTFREIKESISNDIWGLSYEELMAYFDNSKQKEVRA